jgi:hypothetical protein
VIRSAVVTALGLLLAGCGSNSTGPTLGVTQQPSPRPTPSVVSSTIAATTSASSSPASGRRGVVKIFTLTIHGSIPADESFQVYFDAQASPDTFEFCGEYPPNPCVAGKTYTRTLGVGDFYTGPPMAPWRFERVTASQKVIVFKEGTTSMSANETITATYTY